jgi:hypothetical protein
MKPIVLKMIRNNLLCLFLFSMILACVSSTSVNKNPHFTQWPDFQPKIKAGPSQSSMLSSLPQDVKILEPSMDIPIAIRKCSGVWYGNTDRYKTTDIKLAVEEIKREGENYVARVIFAVASGRRKWEPKVFRLNGEFVQNELQIVLPGEKEMVFFRIRPDGNIDVKWIEINSEKWALGVMVKQG